MEYQKLVLFPWCQVLPRRAVTERRRGKGNDPLLCLRSPGVAELKDSPKIPGHLLLKFKKSAKGNVVGLSARGGDRLQKLMTLVLQETERVFPSLINTIQPLISRFLIYGFREGMLRLKPVFFITLFYFDGDCVMRSGIGGSWRSNLNQYVMSVIGSGMTVTCDPWVRAWRTSWPESSRKNRPEHFDCVASNMWKIKGYHRWVEVMVMSIPRSRLIYYPWSYVGETYITLDSVHANLSIT